MRARVVVDGRPRLLLLLGGSSSSRFVAPSGDIDQLLIYIAARVYLSIIVVRLHTSLDRKAFARKLWNAYSITLCFSKKIFCPFPGAQDVMNGNTQHVCMHGIMETETVAAAYVRTAASVRAQYCAVQQPCQFDEMRSNLGRRGRKL